MQTLNRISTIFRETDVSRKEQLLTDLHNEIVFGDGVPLNDYELDDVYHIICAQQESLMLLILLWRLALESNCHPALEQYARRIVEHREETASSQQSQPSDARSLHNTYRHYAVAYVHLHNAPYFVQHMEQLSQEHDPYIVYEVACEIGKSSVFQKITMLIELVETITTHDLYETICMEVMHAGTVEHLAMIREYIKKSQKRSHVYKELAAYLETALKTGFY